MIKALKDIRFFVSSRYFFYTLRCLDTIDIFLDEIFFVNFYADLTNDEKKTPQFVVFYKKWFFINDFYLHTVDTLYLYTYYFVYNKFVYIVFYRNSKINLKLTQTKSNFMYNTQPKSYGKNLFLFSYGLKSVWRFIRLWIFSLTLCVIIFYYCIVVRLFPFTKIIFAWFLLTMFFYWLLSGFVFFVKKYQYRYFTSSIQRFWRRSFVIFWVIEAFLFLIFIYLMLNSNQEPVFMYDNSQVYKTHLFSWRYFLIKIFPSTVLIIASYFILLSLKWNTFSKSNLLCFLITALLGYILWQEFYQFFHLMSFYGNLAWVYDVEDHLWGLEVEFRRTRITNHYLTICLVAKFWHLVFVVIFWMFFVTKCLEVGRIRYPMFSANHQNFIIVYLMSWAYMYPWFKFIWKKFLEMPYFWFYVNTRRMGFFIVFNDLELFFISIFGGFTTTHLINDYARHHYTGFNFFYWHNSSDVTGYSQYKKNFIRDNFIKYACN